jgi:hypothetical protein
MTTDAVEVVGGKANSKVKKHGEMRDIFLKFKFTGKLDEEMKVILERINTFSTYKRTTYALLALVVVIVARAIAGHNNSTFLYNSIPGKIIFWYLLYYLYYNIGKLTIMVGTRWLTRILNKNIENYIIYTLNDYSKELSMKEKFQNISSKLNSEYETRHFVLYLMKNRYPLYYLNTLFDQEGMKEVKKEYIKLRAILISNITYYDFMCSLFLTIVIFNFAEKYFMGKIHIPTDVVKLLTSNVAQAIYWIGVPFAMFVTVFNNRTKKAS